jgi:prolyl-tRNA synthetase
MRGVPLRIEVGPKDVAKGQVVLARRDVAGREGKSSAPMEGLVGRVQEMLDKIQANLFAQARKFRDDNTSEPIDYEEFKVAVEDGFARSYWCGSAECEATIKDETKATIRCVPFDQDEEKGNCIYCGREATEKAIFARAY